MCESKCHKVYLHMTANTACDKHMQSTHILTCVSMILRSKTCSYIHVPGCVWALEKDGESGTMCACAMMMHASVCVSVHVHTIFYACMEERGEREIDRERTCT